MECPNCPAPGRETPQIQPVMPMAGPEMTPEPWRGAWWCEGCGTQEDMAPDVQMRLPRQAVLL